ncbi:MAG: radical SAM protein [Proteobacteria bacterium]|nr:radical SAM protein [Pseudomonadota bacterium]
MEKKFKYIYGPVPSWRVGSSLGIDLLSQNEKICSYGCLYCQLGRTKFLTSTRQSYVPEDTILRELEMLPADISIDYITLSGRGEPTLAINLGDTINALKGIRKEAIAIITNSSLMNRQDVQKELSSADFVIAKLDACSKGSFMAVNQPFQGTEFDVIVQGIKEFKRYFQGKLALQIMFIKENAQYAGYIAGIAKEIHPDEVQINTPLRPCGVEPLKKDELSEIKDLFSGLNAISVYESRKKIVKPISDKDTLKRRGKV